MRGRDPMISVRKKSEAQADAERAEESQQELGFAQPWHQQMLCQRSHWSGQCLVYQTELALLLLIPIGVRLSKSDGWVTGVKWRGRWEIPMPFPLACTANIFTLCSSSHPNCYLFRQEAQVMGSLLLEGGRWIICSSGFQFPLQSEHPSTLSEVSESKRHAPVCRLETEKPTVQHNPTFFLHFQFGLGLLCTEYPATHLGNMSNVLATEDRTHGQAQREEF